VSALITNAFRSRAAAAWIVESRRERGSVLQAPVLEVIRHARAGAAQPNHDHLALLDVHPDHQGRGIGIVRRRVEFTDRVDDDP